MEKGRPCVLKMKRQDLSGQQEAPREGGKQEKAWIRFVLYQDHCQLGCGKAGAGAGQHWGRREEQPGGPREGEESGRPAER